MQLSEISSILGGTRALSTSIDTPMDLIELSEKGVTKGSLLRLADHLGLSAARVAQLLPVTERTIQRYSRTQRFNCFVSEHILQLAEVAARGGEVFGDRDRLLSWLNHPSRALSGRTPVSLLSSRFGAQMVLDELGRIERGVMA